MVKLTIILGRYIHALAFFKPRYDIYKAVKLALKYGFIENPCVQWLDTDDTVIIFTGPAPLDYSNAYITQMKHGRKTITAIMFDTDQLPP